MLKSKKLRVGDWIEVRDKEEILATLDRSGQLDGLPFMPQMFQYCGKRFQIYKRAHKTCDTVNPIRSLRLSNVVHLDLRCDGKAYGNCGAACLIYWKTSWLKPIESGVGQCGAREGMSKDGRNTPHQASWCSEQDVLAGTRRKAESPDEWRYVCQATQLPMLGPELPWWDVRQYVEDYSSGNTSLGRMARGALYYSYWSVIQSGIGVGRPLRWLYDAFQSLWGGVPFPRRTGVLPIDHPTPRCTSNIQAGELVRVKSYKEILSTLNTDNKNRGLYFDAELVPYCEGTYRVRSKVEHFVDEKTGKLVTLKNPSLLLEGAICQARYSACRMFCPRGIYAWWREIWVERVSQPAVAPPDTEIRKSALR